MTTNKQTYRTNSIYKTVPLTLLFTLALSPMSHVYAGDFAGSLKGVTITDSGGTNAPPTAVINYTQNGDTINFDGSGSADSDGSITEYKWDFGDGSTGVGVNQTHQFSGGSFSVTLSVVDNSGGVALIQVTISTVPAVWLNATALSSFNLLYVDSEDSYSPASYAFDRNSTTLWHTEWRDSNPPPPHEIQIDLGSSFTIDGFSYLPSQEGGGAGVNGTIVEYEFYVSGDGSTWGNAVTSGSFVSDQSLKEVFFVPVNGRYVRLRALAEINDNPWTSAAEIDVHGKK